MRVADSRFLWLHLNFPKLLQISPSEKGKKVPPLVLFCFNWLAFSDLTIDMCSATNFCKFGKRHILCAWPWLNGQVTVSIIDTSLCTLSLFTNPFFPCFVKINLYRNVKCYWFFFLLETCFFFLNCLMCGVDYEILAFLFYFFLLDDKT